MPACAAPATVNVMIKKHSRQPDTGQIAIFAEQQLKMFP